MIFGQVIKELSDFCDGTFLLPLALVFVVLYVWKSDSKIKKQLLVGILLLIVFVFNDVSMSFIEKLGYDREYYRFFWMLPVVAVLSVGCAQLVEKLQNRWQKILAVCGLLAVLVLAGNPFRLSINVFPDNPYMLNVDVVEVCDAISEIKDEENPRVAFSYDMNLQSRQYDASIHNVLTRQAYEQASAMGYYTEPGKYIYQMEIMKLVNAGLCESVDYFRESLKEEDVDYLVVSNQYDAEAFLEETGCQKLVELTNYSIYENINN